jgi:hypothetical protein
VLSFPVPALLPKVVYADLKVVELKAILKGIHTPYYMLSKWPVYDIACCCCLQRGG